MTGRRGASPARAILTLALAAVATAASAQEPLTDLARQLQNPVADLLSVPLQNDFDFHIGADGDGFRYTLSVEPVIPIALTDDWNLILRTSLPLIEQDEIFVGSGTQIGLGDTLQSVFLAPRGPGPGGLIWGVGPVLLLPTATDDLLGSGKWGAGPTAVLLIQPGSWTLGALTRHVWSFAGEADRRDISQTLLQPFAAHILPNAVTIALTSDVTYDWETERWIVLFEGGLSRVFRLGARPVSLGLFARYWIERPQSAPEWGLRAVATFLFPR